MPLDEWAGDSGLKDDWDGTISSQTEFTQTERGNWALKVHVTADDGDDQEYLYSVGGKDKGWTSYDGGETIQGPSAKARFHQNSTIQGFINALMATEAEEILKERSIKEYDRKGPFHAAVYHGLRFHWEVVEEMGRRPKEEGSSEWVEVKVQVVRPTRFLGVTEGSSSSATATPSRATSASSSAGENVSEAASTNGIGADINEADRKILVKLAVTHDTYETFLDAVMEGQSAGGESFMKVPEVRKVMGKKEFYESLKG